MEKYKSKLYRLTVLFTLFNLISVKFLCGQVIPASPASREYEKYLTYPISLTNGLPNIRIPLYEIKIGDLVIPIELKYHASGIKYGQSSGDVGVGWVLDPGYRVSRTIYGRPDEFYSKPQSSESLPTFTSNSARDEFLSQFISNGAGSDPDLPNSGVYLDGEYDIFNYISPRGGGSFIIDDRINNKLRALTLDNQEVSFKRITGSSNIDYFEINDGYGKQYRFGKSLGAGIRYEEKLNEGSSPIVPSSWMLTDISDDFGNFLKFSYKIFRESEYTPEATFSLLQGGTVSGGAVYNNSFNLNIRPNFNRYSDVQRLTSLESGNDKVLFFRNENMSGTLDSIRIETKAGIVLKRIIFTYTAGSNHNYLQQVQIFDSNKTVEQKWKMDYYKKDLGLSFNDFIPDYWGYYKRIYQGGPLWFPDFGIVKYYPENMTSNGVDAKEVGLNVMDKNANELSDYFMLASIEYPTKGKAEYIYEPNKYLGRRDDDNIMGEKIAGVRISKITLDDGKGGKSVKRYVYGPLESGTGNVNVDLANRNLYARECIWLDYPPLSSLHETFSKTYFYSSTPSEIGHEAMVNAPVKYSQVVEYEEDNEFLFSSKNGKTVYEYEYSPRFSWQGFGNNPSNYSTKSTNWGGRRYSQYYINHDYLTNGVDLKRKSIYKNDAGIFTLLQKEEFEYSTIYKGQLNGLKVRRFMETPISYTPGLAYYSSGVNSIFDHAIYSIVTGGRLLTKNTTTSFDSNGSVTNEETYRYNDKYLVSNKEFQDSNGDKSGEVTNYISDFANLSGPIYSMAAKYSLLPVEKVIYKQIGSKVYIISGEASSFFTTGKGLVENQYQILVPNPILLSSFKFAGSAIGQFPWATAKTNYQLDTKYVKKVNYPNYDTYGNPLSVNKTGGTIVTYLWGYNGQYPIAAIKNATYAEVLAVLGQSVIDNLNMPSHTEATMETLITNAVKLLRQDSRLSKAMVTNYTYKPLVGMSSKTDERGMTEYYQYDGMQRLKAVLDESKDITRTIDYNYRSN